jgi:ATP-dependent Clp protease ATP-binding subunit ClpB
MVDSVFPGLTEEVKRALFFARQVLSRHGGTHLEAEHMLLGVLEVRAAGITRFTTPDWTAQHIQDRLIALLSSLDPQKLPPDASVPAGASLGRVLLRAAAEADGLGSKDILIEHITLALVSDAGSAGQVLREAGIDREQILLSLRQRSTEPNATITKSIDATPKTNGDPPSSGAAA